MNKITIRTNNQYRPLLSWDELTEKEQKEFDYINNPDEETGLDFFRYKKDAYYLGNFFRLEKNNFWSGGMSFTAFSGLYVKLSNCGEGVMIGYFYY